MSVSADEIKVILTADASDLQVGMAQATAATTSSVQAQMAAFGELDALLEGHTETLEQLAALYAWHGRHHVAQVEALRRRNGW